MRTIRLLPLLFFVPVVCAVLATAADAAPTAEVALDRYRAALVERKLDMDRQGVIFETLDGSPLLAYNVDCPFNPASVVKLATSDVALTKFGPNYRFSTSFFTNGMLDVENGTLVGDLVIVGAGDPSLTTENAFYVARELRARGIRRITGSLVVKGPLYMNYSMDRRGAGAVLVNALDVEKWNGSIEAAFGRYQVITRQDTFESVVVEGPVAVEADTRTTGLLPLFALKSMPLVKILKRQNDFSNNWMSHVVGSTVGGASGVERSMFDRFKIPSSELHLATTSGLGSNGMRPTDVILLLRDLREQLQKEALTPAHLMPVGGIDEGTLDDRYLAPGLRGAVVAKTGTLRSVSALAGFMYTRNRGVVLFAIMNQGGTPVTFRKLQDYLVTEMFEACGGPAPISYSRPVGFSGLSGIFIERAPGNIPAMPKGALEAAN